jgi:hypothetical protein
MNWQKLPEYKPEDTTTMNVIAHMSLRHLTSTDESPFLWKMKRQGLGEFEQRFVHEKARNGARFQDGNNGDHWRVIVALPEYKRLLVQNLSQDFVTIMYWD